MSHFAVVRYSTKHMNDSNESASLCCLWDIKKIHFSAVLLHTENPKAALVKEHSIY